MAVVRESMPMVVAKARSAVRRRSCSRLNSDVAAARRYSVYSMSVVVANPLSMRVLTSSRCCSNAATTFCRTATAAWLKTVAKYRSTRVVSVARRVAVAVDSVAARVRRAARLAAMILPPVKMGWTA